MVRSPYASNGNVPLYVIAGTVRRALSGCLVKIRDNKAQSKEWGVAHVNTITAHIPKALLHSPPSITHDALEYKGRRYTIESLAGEADHSAVWVVKGSSPIKS